MANQSYTQAGTPQSYNYPMYAQGGQMINGTMPGAMTGAMPGMMYGAMPGTIPGMMNGGQAPGRVFEESYIENILRLNLGKVATIYMTFENNPQWNAKTFKGRLEAAGRDHIIISDPKSGMRYLLLMVNLDYITFDEPLQYAYPTQMGGAPAGR